MNLRPTIVKHALKDELLLLQILRVQSVLEANIKIQMKPDHIVANYVQREDGPIKKV